MLGKIIFAMLVLYPLLIRSYNLRIFTQLLSRFLPKKLHYYHTPIQAIEHSNDANIAEYFSGMGHFVPTAASLMPYLRGKIGKTSTYRRKSIFDLFRGKDDQTKITVVDHRHLKAWLENISVGNYTCDSHVLYSVDNCWDVVYRPPFQERINDVHIINSLREIYFSTGKPEIRFDANKINIVVHIRKGDAGNRVLQNK